LINIFKTDKVKKNYSSQLMKKFFRLYTDNQSEYNSSIFDLISGDKETKQTKGLAYIFSQYTDFLFDFLEYQPVLDTMLCHGCTINKKDITVIEISAERFTTDKKRADIVIKIDSNKAPLIAIIIEAKSIKVNTNQQDLHKQIKGYLEDNQFPDLKEYIRVGVALTKYNQNIPDIANVSWENLIQLLLEFCKKKESKNTTINQYLKFITEIDKEMKYYEKEVLSIPAGKSLKLVEQFNIYVCPDTKNYNYKKPIFVGFRKAGGGIMERLYKIEDIIILNPTVKSEVETFNNSVYSTDIKRRILNYIKAANYGAQIDFDERFYILSETEVIELNNKPRPKKNNAKFTYYTLSEVLSKEIIVPASQQ
jgi:hypothetical protein